MQMYTYKCVPVVERAPTPEAVTLLLLLLLPPLLLLLLLLLLHSTNSVLLCWSRRSTRTFQARSHHVRQVALNSLRVDATQILLLLPATSHTMYAPWHCPAATAMMPAFCQLSRALARGSPCHPSEVSDLEDSKTGIQHCSSSSSLWI